MHGEWDESHSKLPHPTCRWIGAPCDLVTIAVDRAREVKAKHICPGVPYLSPTLLFSTRYDLWGHNVGGRAQSQSTYRGFSHESWPIPVCVSQLPASKCELARSFGLSNLHVFRFGLNPLVNRGLDRVPTGVRGFPKVATAVFCGIQYY